MVLDYSSDVSYTEFDVPLKTDKHIVLEKPQANTIFIIGICAV